LCCFIHRATCITNCQRHSESRVCI
jgi:hypothetical protein